jgi:hypothetical protein
MPRKARKTVAQKKRIDLDNMMDEDEEQVSLLMLSTNPLILY